MPKRLSHCKSPIVADDQGNFTQEAQTERPALGDDWMVELKETFRTMLEPKHRMCVIALEGRSSLM